MRQKLSNASLLNFKGLATKLTPETQELSQLKVAKNSDFFKKYGGFSKCNGSSRVLSSIYTEASVAQPISWIGFYKAPDLNGQILRHVLVAAGSKLHRIDSGSLTALTGSGLPVSSTRKIGLVHSAERFDDFLLIQNQDVSLVGNGDIPVKYDGKNVQRWGVIPPGSEETLIETFNSASSFTVSGGTASNEATTTQDGASTKFNKTSTTQQNGDISRTGVTPFSIDTTIPNRAQVFFYIPRGELTNFSGTSALPAVQIFVGTDLVANYYRFDFPVGRLIEGWNQLSLNFYNKLDNDTDTSTDDPDVQIVGAPNAAVLTAYRFRINSNANATLITGVVWDKFNKFDKGAPTVTEGAVGTVFSTGSKYKYKITYLTKYGVESNASPESAMMETTLARSTILLTGIPVSTDPQVIARKIYRTVAGGQISLFVDIINNNSDTTFTDTFSDVGIAAANSPPETGDVSDDNSPPPLAGIIKKWKRTVFLAGLPDRPEVVVFSDDNEPESFPTLNEVNLDSKITAMYETYSGFVIETELGKWQVTGDNPDFQFDKVIKNIGCVGRRAAGEARVSGWSVDRDGMRLYDLNNPVKISEVIRDLFDGFDKTNIEKLQTMHSKTYNAILMLVANSSGEFKNNNYLYQYPLDQLGQGWWWQLDLPSNINPLDLEEIEDSNGTSKIYFGGDDGMVYELFANNVKNWTLANGSTSAITSEIETVYFRPAGENENPESYSGRVMPRLIEISYDGDVGSTWTVTISTANGPSQTTPLDSRTVTFTFDTNESLLRMPVPVIQPGEFLKLNIKNTQLNITGTINLVKIYYYVQPGQFPLESGSMQNLP